MVNHIGHSSNIYVAQYDLKPNCPGCYSNHNVNSIGTLHIDGVPETTYQCTSCTRAFTGAQGGVAALIDAAKASTNADHVTFTSTTANITDGSGSLSSGNATISGTWDGYNISNTLSTIANNTNSNYSELNQIKNEMQYLRNSIEDLVTTIETLVKKNLELQSDPLMGLKKKIQDFSLQ